MLSVLLTLIVVGVLLWAVVTYVPLQPQIKNIIVIFVVVCVVLWLLEIFGIWDAINVPVPRFHK